MEMNTQNKGIVNYRIANLIVGLLLMIVPIFFHTRQPFYLLNTINIEAHGTGVLSNLL